jgi:WD40 repeat protein
LAYSADDKRLAVSGPGPSWGKEVSQVQVWDLESGKVVLTLNDTWGSVAFSPDGSRLASCWDHFETGDPDHLDRFKAEGRVKVSDAVSGKEIFWLRGHPNRIASVAFSPDGKRLASASSDGVKLWDMETGKELRALPHSVLVKWVDLERPEGVRAVAFSPDGKKLASAGRRNVKVWDVAGGQELMTFEEPTDLIGKVAFSPDGKRLAVAYVTDDLVQSSSVKVWDLTTGQAVQTIKGHAGPLSFSADGKRLFSEGRRLATGVDESGTVKAWELASGQEVFTLRGPSSPVAFSHDGKRVASMSADGVRIWDLASSQDCLNLAGSKRFAQGLAFSPDSKHLAGATGLADDQAVKLWDVASGREIRTFLGHTGLVTCVAFSPDGKTLATSSYDKTVKLWDVDSGKELIRTIPEHTRKVARVAFSPDGTYLASAENSDERPVPSVRVWEAASGKEVLTIERRGNALAFSADSKRLATQFAGVVKLVDVPSGREILTAQGHRTAVLSVAFSPDGTRLASASRDKTVKVWNLADGREIMTLRDHTNQVQSVAFSPDGRRLASGSSDHTVKIWDAATGHEVLTLKGHTALVPCVIFSPDGKRLASASVDATIKIWDASKSMKESGTSQPK